MDDRFRVLYSHIMIGGKPVVLDVDAAMNPNVQSHFLKHMGCSQQVRFLFEHLADVYFFVKDRESRMVCASQPILDRLGLKSEAEIVGTTDYEHFPPHVADGFVADDQQVMSSRKPLINRVEVWYNEQRLLDWFVTNKLPVCNDQGDVIGVMGTVRSFEGNRKSVVPYAQISEAVDFIRENHRGKLTVGDIANELSISPRQLNRRFRNSFGMSAQEFLTKTRLQAAMDMLISTDASILEIALQFGFCDQSAFTHQFSKNIGITPRRFRLKHRR